MNKYISFTTILLILIVVSQSCKKKDEENSGNDAALFDLARQSGYTYYVGTPGITAGVGNSPHGFERVRFNATAQAALDTTGKLPAGSSFPTGSVIVKEIYTSATGSINLYAVMKKDPSSSVSGSGYEWAEFKTDGTASFSTEKKGDGCISCHSGSLNRDLARTFDLH
ncbi:hypothetical protein BH11BAC1_BH11BAC1_13030 [soil metagenome]